MNKCLVICPTYNRSYRFVQMVHSFYRTSVCSDLITLTAKGSITKLINSVNFKNYSYISVTNDDFVYHTHAWDKKLIDVIERKGKGIAFGDDGSKNTQLPTTCIMSSEIPTALKYIQYSKLTHLCGDMVWQTIGKLCNCLYYVPDVKIEHNHFMFNKADKSEYAISNSREMYKKDNAVFKEWLLHESKEDAEKVKLVL